MTLHHCIENMQLLWFLKWVVFAPIVFAKISTLKHRSMSGKAFSALSVAQAASRDVRHESLVTEVNAPFEVQRKPNMGYIQGLVAGYNSQLQKNPYVTKMITSSLVSGLGDVLVQLMSNPDTVQDLNYRRTAVMMMVGGLYVAPLMHNWFNLLSKLPLPQRLSPFGTFN